MDQQQFAAIGFVSAPAFEVSGSVMADYEVVYMNEVRATHLGNILFESHNILKHVFIVFHLYYNVNQEISEDTLKTNVFVGKQFLVLLLLSL